MNVELIQILWGILLIAVVAISSLVPFIKKIKEAQKKEKRRVIPSRTARQTETPEVADEFPETVKKAQHRT